MNIYKSVDELIGKTPIVEFTKLEKKLSLKSKLLAKIESFNPAGSVKDRVAKNIIDNFEIENKINKNTTIIEATSGNTGIGLASICAARGYKLIIVMPETMSIERRNLMKAYGAEIVLTEGSKGMKGAVEKANELCNEIENSIIAGQFINLSNPEIHKKTTGPEIFNDTNGNIDIFVSGVGTGGTITGVGEYLKEKDQNIKIVAIEPVDSPVLSENKSGSHKIQGIGAGFVPDILNTKIYDEIIKVSNEDAFNMTNLIAKTEGILVGISSGAAIFAATILANKPENYNKNIVVLLPDTGDRYLSMNVFN